MLNEIPLFAGITTPTRVVVGDSPDLLLVVMSAGTLELSGPAFTANSNAGGIVLAPVAGSELEISGERCAITLRPAAIARAAAVMAGRRSGVTRRERQRFDQPKPVALPAGHPQATVMQQLIRTIDACLAAGPQVAMRLGLDDQLQRTVASLLQPELLSEEPDDLLRLRERTGSDAFDELIDHIRANLDQPLRMSDLEARSHYSRRALQYAFQERLGCSPKQWIREQRLALALEQLQADGKRPTIRALALACGYLDANHFSTDFKRRFGETPSQARRR